MNILVAPCQATNVLCKVVDCFTCHNSEPLDCIMQDCKNELLGLLKEEKLVGASLLILANKQDLPSALTVAEIIEVSISK